MTEPTPGAAAPLSLPLSERFPRQLELAALIDPEAFAETRGVDGDRPGKAQRHRALEVARRLLDAGVALPGCIGPSGLVGEPAPEVAGAIHSVRVAHRKAVERDQVPGPVDEVAAAFVANLGILLAELDRLQAGAAPADAAPVEAVLRDLTQSELYAALGLAGDLVGPDEALRVSELRFTMDRDRGGVVQLHAKLRVDEAEAVAVAETFGLPADRILEDPEAAGCSDPDRPEGHCCGDAR